MGKARKAQVVAWLRFNGLATYDAISSAESGGDEDYAGVDVTLFNREELHDAFRSCRNKKTPGLDLLTTEILKKPWSCICEYLLVMANQMMLEGHLSDPWKAGELSILLKYQIYWFRPGRGTVDALEKVIRDVSESDCRYVLAIYLDISGAFDSAWWPGIPDKLRRTGCRRTCMKWIELEAKAESAIETVIAWGAVGRLTFMWEKTNMTFIKGKHSVTRHPMVRMGGAPIGYNGRGNGEGSVREAHPSLKDFLGIGLLDSTEDVQGHGGVGPDLWMHGVAASDGVTKGYSTVSHDDLLVVAWVLPINLLVRERIGRYWTKNNGLDLDEERRNGQRDSLAAW
uniref:Reverse transcriptase domain-containing protein n=1 Tax=Timema poppense TaxID=170557 RepID=A0A7R9H9P6_TIMPO|nr:unnamed protein product [Timema poppensis]